MTSPKSPPPLAAPSAQQRLDWLASSRRQEAAFDALAEAVSAPIAAGLTADELRATARRFAAICEEVGPRRGLMRFGRYDP